MNKTTTEDTGLNGQKTANQTKKAFQCPFFGKRLLIVFPIIMEDWGRVDNIYMHINIESSDPHRPVSIKEKEDNINKERKVE